MAINATYGLKYSNRDIYKGLTFTDIATYAGYPKPWGLGTALAVNTMPQSYWDQKAEELYQLQQPPELPDVPSYQDTVDMARRRERLASRQRKGRLSTILTGSAPAKSVLGGRTILGGAQGV